MPTMDELGQEKQRLSERLARIDAEREKIAAQLNELEVAERVLARFGGAGETQERRRRGRPARAPEPQQQRRGRGGQRTSQRASQRGGEGTSGMSLSEATLQAVGAHPEGLAPDEILAYLEREMGLKARPNHLGIALQRHRRGGRLETRDSRWFLPQSASQDSAPVGHESLGC